MKIALIDIDSRIPNLALAKIAKWHSQRGDEVLWNPGELFAFACDKIYVSCVFTENRQKAERWVGLAEIGGTGYDLSKALPPEIEAVRPRINLGFTTRGCSRRCPFCLVPKKEGDFRVVGDLYDLWDRKSEDVTLLDNNILCDPGHFVYMCKQSLYPRIRLDFNQGLDHRLLTPQICGWLKKIRHKQLRFAWDRPGGQGAVDDAIEMLADVGISQSLWYVLVGFNTSFSDDLYRLNHLRSKRQAAFVMRYTKHRGNLLISQWANQHKVFGAMDFTEFLRIPRFARYLRKYGNEIQHYFDPAEFS